MAELLTVGGVSKLSIQLSELGSSGLTSEGVRAAERRGELRAQRAGMVRLFERSEVMRFLKERTRRKAAR